MHQKASSKKKAIWVNVGESAYCHKSRVAVENQLPDIQECEAEDILYEDSKTAVQIWP